MGAAGERPFLQILPIGVSSRHGEIRWGEKMKRLVLIAALCAAAAQQPGWAAGKTDCYSPSAIEAEQAIRFLTDVMVVSSTCQDTVYAEFRLRNRDPILAYQKAMIAHFHGAPAFDRWNTSLANQAASKRAGVLSVQVCQQAADLLKQASALDPPKFRAFAAAQAAAAGPQYPKCGK
jgi:hypothetical protein